MTFADGHFVPGGLQFKFPAAPSTLDSKFPVRRFDFDGRTLSEAGFDLLSSLLTLDPDRRATAEEALNHRWYAHYALCDNHTSYGSAPLSALLLALSCSALLCLQMMLLSTLVLCIHQLVACSARWALLQML